MPPLPEQKRIAGILDQADTIRRKRRAAIDELNTLIPALFYDMFGDPGTNPKGWPHEPLESLCNRKGQYGANCSAIPFDGKTRYLRITDITDTGSLNGDRVSADLSEEEEKEKYRLEDGDVLFARTGATVGKTYRYRPEDGPCVFAGYLIRYRPDPKKLLPDVLESFTHTPWYWAWVQSCQKTVAQPNINAKQYGQLGIMTPPISLQTDFAKKVESIRAIQDKYRQVADEAEDLFHSLVQRAFKGEL